MSHSSAIVARLGLPPNPCRSPDPEVRRAYWRELARLRAARKDAAKSRDRCAHRVGAGTCGGTLEHSIDRTGKVTTRCPKCARRLAGLCATCPRKIVGDPKRGASWCAPCRRRHVLDRRAAYAKADPERHAAGVRRRRRKARRKLLRDLRSKDPAIRAAAEAKHARQLLAQRNSYARMVARRRAKGLPANPRSRAA